MRDDDLSTLTEYQVDLQLKYTKLLLKRLKAIKTIQEMYGGSFPSAEKTVTRIIPLDLNISKMAY